MKNIIFLALITLAGCDLTQSVPKGAFCKDGIVWVQHSGTDIATVYNNFGNTVDCVVVPSKVASR